MKRLMIKIIPLLLLSSIAIADYVVYPNGKDIKSVNLPEPEELCVLEKNVDGVWIYQSRYYNYRSSTDDSWNSINYKYVTLKYKGVTYHNKRRGSFSVVRINGDIFNYEGKDYRLEQLGTLDSYSTESGNGETVSDNSTYSYYSFCLVPVE